MTNTHCELTISRRVRANMAAHLAALAALPAGHPDRRRIPAHQAHYDHHARVVAACERAGLATGPAPVTWDQVRAALAAAEGSTP